MLLAGWSRQRAASDCTDHAERLALLSTEGNIKRGVHARLSVPLLCPMIASTVTCRGSEPFTHQCCCSLCVFCGMPGTIKNRLMQVWPSLPHITAAISIVAVHVDGILRPDCCIPHNQTRQGSPPWLAPPPPSPLLNTRCKTLMASSMYDVSWCHHGGRVAASLSNGGVAIWDLQHLATDADVRGDDGGKIIGNHERSVNRLCWDPHDHGQLLSGSQARVFFW